GRALFLLRYRDGWGRTYLLYHVAMTFAATSNAVTHRLDAGITSKRQFLIFVVKAGCWRVVWYEETTRESK
ncbi:MAG: hypothetical protein WAM42_08190, partial [Candidatus Nitrosopolaris sp.]